MTALLPYFLVAVLVIPLATAALVPWAMRASEHAASRVASLASGLLLLAGVAALSTWTCAGFPLYELELGDLYQSSDYRFPLVLFLDRTGAVFLAVTLVLGAIIVKYCRYYMHREEGYGRFFATIFLFLFGMNLLTLSGTLDLLFAGWEVVGIASFLLIGFYRERTIPVRNALRAYSVYRLCDIGLLVGAWLGHALWHKSQHFRVLETLGAGDPSSWVLLAMSFLLLLAASGKSAQFPFCFWLSRAMEGPTPSSAIFYGALSIHAGVFLLLRTMPIWSLVPAARLAMGVIGGVTALLATLCGRTQSNIKGQIAYASIGQVGLMLVELSLGLRTLVLFHFVANASLRCYQLLVSPSVVAHLLRVQSSGTTKLAVSDWSWERRLPTRLRTALYVFALQEGFLEAAMRWLLWRPVSVAGRLACRRDKAAIRFVAIGIALGLLTATHVSAAAQAQGDLAAAVLAVFMAFFSLSAFAERASAMRAWNAVGLSCGLAAGAVVVADPHALFDTGVFFMGLAPCWMLGVFVLDRLAGSDERLSLVGYRGLVAVRPKAAFVLFMAFLGVAGFPITPAFIGEDLLLHHATGKVVWLSAAITATFVLNGLALARLYSHLCLGPAEPAQARVESPSRAA